MMERARRISDVHAVTTPTTPRHRDRGSLGITYCGAAAFVDTLPERFLYCPAHSPPGLPSRLSPDRGVIQRMTSRVCRVGVAILASLTLARVCPAAEPGSSPGRGGIGGQIGVSSFKLDRALGSE